MPVPAAVPMAMPMVSPAHLFRPQILDLGPGGDGGTHIRIRRLQPFITGQRLRRQRRGLRARGQRGGARGNSSGKFQKMASFHDIFLFGAMVMREEFECVEMNSR